MEEKSTMVMDQLTMGMNVPVEIKEKKKELWKNASRFYRICLIFSVFYVFCLFDNPIGITYPVFTVGFLTLYQKLMKYEEQKLKKDSAFYIISMILLSVSTCLTDNAWIIWFNKIGIWLLFGILVLHNSYEDREWKFTKYLGSMYLFFFHIIGNFFSAFSHKRLWKTEKDKSRSSQITYILMGLGISIPLLGVILSLLVSADVVFSNLVGRIIYIVFREIIIPTKLIRMFLMFLLGFLFFYSLLYCISRKELDSEQKDRRSQEPLIAITFLSLIAAVYLIFCGIQISYVFTNGIHLPSGYTYSTYARQGFFQLLFVCMINLALVLTCLGLFRENKLLKLLLTFISGCTYIMIISSAYRMLLYIGAYQLTRLRILVLAALLVLAVLLGGVIRSIYKEKFPLFKFSTFVVTAVYVILSLSRIDAIIASYNISKVGLHITEENQYITTLSADAAGIYADAYADCDEVTELAEEKLDCYFGRIRSQKEIRIRNFNLSQYLGKQSAEQYFNQKMKQD